MNEQPIQTGQSTGLVHGLDFQKELFWAIDQQTEAQALVTFSEVVNVAEYMHVLFQIGTMLENFHKSTYFHF